MFIQQELATTFKSIFLKVFQERTALAPKTTPKFSLSSQVSGVEQITYDMNGATTNTGPARPRAAVQPACQEQQFC